jgi:hypothetical protein
MAIFTAEGEEQCGEELAAEYVTFFLPHGTFLTRVHSLGRERDLHLCQLDGDAVQMVLVSVGERY